MFLGTACINPPIPPEINNLTVVYDWDEVTEIPFEDTVVYECIDGFHFHEDYFMESFELKCLPGGGWETPAIEEWRWCVDPNSKYCTVLHT